MINSPYNNAEDTIDELIANLSFFSEQEINTVPFTGSWTAAQVGEHLLKSYSVVETLYGNTEPTTRQPDQKVDTIRSLFLDFQIKMKSPEFVIPSDNIIEKGYLLNSLQKRKAEICTAINSLDLTETCLDFIIPEFGSFTRYEWICFVIVHTQRHNHQLKNIAKKILEKP